MILENVSLLSFGSHKKITVTCDFKVSNKCRKEYKSVYKDIIRYRKVNNNKDICLYCSRKIKSSGRKNPNTKYFDLNDNFFEDINSKEKAYILGFIASDGYINSIRNCITIGIHLKDKYILNKIKEIISPSNQVKINPLKNQCNITFSSKKMVEDLQLLLKYTGTKKSKVVQFPEIKEELIFDFLRGYFDGDGSIRKPNIFRTLDCSISSSSIKILEQIKEKCQIPSSICGNKIIWNSNNALDFLGKLYDNSEKLFLIRKKQRYLQWANYWPHKMHTKNNIPYVLKYKKTLKEAVDPFKKNVTDSGFDLTLIKLIKDDGMLYSYDTGMVIQPNFGWYMDIVPRSSLYKTGYILANSVGIIDRTYTGNIIVNLLKVDKTKPGLELPFRAVQMIPRSIIHPVLIEIKEDELSVEFDLPENKQHYIIGNGDNNTFFKTERGNKGFGSSDENKKNIKSK